MKRDARRARAVLAVDLGRTGCRADLWVGDAATPLASAQGEGTLGLTAPDGANGAAQAILAVVRPMLAEHLPAGVDSAGVGAPGAITAPDAARALGGLLCESLPARSVAVASDAVTSHAGALAGEAGVVLAAGTGAVVVAIGPGKRFHRVDGWGPWLGDEGSGAWLGLAGLRAAARAYDGRGPGTLLLQAACVQFESLAQIALKLSADANPARVAAAFAPAVARAAAKGDAVAAELVRAAAAALAQSVITGVNALADALPPSVPVAILGGLAELGAVLLDPLRAALARSATPLDVRPAAGTSLDGARRLAVHVGGIHEPWTVRAGEAVADTSQAIAGAEADLR